QGALAADFHRGDAFVPAGNDTLLTNRKLERLVAVDRRVELLALGAIFVKPSGVVHDAGLTRPRRRAGADLDVDVLKPGRGRHRLAALCERGLRRDGSGCERGEREASGEGHYLLLQKVRLIERVADRRGKQNEACVAVRFEQLEAEIRIIDIERIDLPAEMRA